MLAAIVGLALLYFISKRSSAGAVVPSGPGINNPTAGINDPTSSAAGPGVKGPGSDRDVAPDGLEDGEWDVFVDDNYWGQGPNSPAASQWGADWRGRLKRQVIDPAQALTSADLSQEHFDLAVKLLANTLTPQTDPTEMSSLQKQQAQLNAQDATAEELYGIWKQIANIAGAFTFGLTALAANEVDTLAGTDGQTVTAELAADDALLKKLSALTGRDLSNLIAWIGPVEQIGSTNPAEFSSKTPHLVAPVALGTYVSPTGVVPVYYRTQLFLISRAGMYLRWNAVELTSGLTFRQRVNLRARIYRALDVIACQLFPFPVKYDPSVPDPAGLFTYWNAAYRGVDGKASGWLKGSVFHPNVGKGDWTIAGLKAIKAAGNTQLNPIATPASQGNVALTVPPSVGITLLTPTTVATLSKAGHRAI